MVRYRRIIDGVIAVVGFRGGCVEADLSVYPTKWKNNIFL